MSAFTPASVAAGTRRACKIAVAAAACLAFAATAASGTSLMTQDRVFSNTSPAANQLKDVGYSVAGYMGAQHMRMIVARDTRSSWAATDVFVDESRARGFAPYLTLTYRPHDWGGPGAPMAIPSNAEFAFWCREAAQRYLGRVSHYGVWNEPNHLPVGAAPGQMLTPAQYGGLYRACYAEIKAVDPGAKVHIGELSTKPGACDFLDGALPRAITTLTDGVAIHPYQFRTSPRTALPEDCRGIGNLPDWNARVGALHTANRLETPQGARAPLVLSEFGYCTTEAYCGESTRPGLSEATRAQWIGEAYELAEQQQVAIFSYYHLVKDDNQAVNWDSGIVNGDSLTVTPSVPALRAAVGGAVNPESDVNGDGLADLVTLENLNATQGTAWFHAGDWDRSLPAGVSSFGGTMDPAQYDDVGHHVLDVADVNGDGRSDLVTLTHSRVACTYLGSTTGVFPGPCVESFRNSVTRQGTMQPEILPGSPGGHEPIGVADVTGDGRGDLVTFTSPTGNVLTYPGTPSGSFGASVSSFGGTGDSARLDGVGHYFVDVADVTGDGRADLVSQYTPTGVLAVYPGQASGAFLDSSKTPGIASAMASGSGIEPIGVADVTGDRRADFVGFDTASQNVYVYPGQASGFLGAGVASFAGTMQSRLFSGGAGHEIAAVIDVNGDRHADLVTVAVSGGLGTVIVYEGRPNGTFVEGVANWSGAWSTAQFNVSPGHQVAMEKPARRRRGCVPAGCSP